MNRYRSILHGCALATSLVATCSIVAAQAASPQAEPERLTAVVRQLDLLDRTISEAERLPADVPSRYRFDYGRLRADIARVRGGIEAYLNPERAQPRDPVPLAAGYVRRDEGEAFLP